MEKVLIGMSGGVDSSVSALLLKEKGYEVIGATMLLTDDKEKNDKIVEDARNVCKQIGISFYLFDFREEFRKNVICNFINCLLTRRRLGNWYRCFDNFLNPLSIDPVRNSI